MINTYRENIYREHKEYVKILIDISLCENTLYNLWYKGAFEGRQNGKLQNEIVRLKIAKINYELKVEGK